MHISTPTKLERCLTIGTFLQMLVDGHSIIDFICPFDEDRLEYDVRVWMNTIKKGRFDDTNKMFEKPSHCHFEITNFDYQKAIKEIRDKL